MNPQVSGSTRSRSISLRDRCILSSMWAAVLAEVLSRCAYRSSFSLSVFLSLFLFLHDHVGDSTDAILRMRRPGSPPFFSWLEQMLVPFWQKPGFKEEPLALILSWWHSNENTMSYLKQYCITFLSFKLNYKQKNLSGSQQNSVAWGKGTLYHT